jgi:hypothetical protein
MEVSSAQAILLLRKEKGDHKDSFPKWNDPKRLCGGSHQDQADPIQLPLYSLLKQNSETNRRLRYLLSG